MRINNTPILETERLVLRRFTKDDIEAILHIYKDPEVNTFLPWHPIKTMEEAMALYEENYEQSYKKPRGYKYAVCLKSDNIPVGYVHVSTDDSYDLGYGLRREFWHSGIMREAAEAVVKQVKEDGFSYITATHDVRNHRSGELMKGLGMNYQYTYEEQWHPLENPITFRMYQLNFDNECIRRYDKYWIISKVHYIEDNLEGFPDVKRV